MSLADRARAYCEMHYPNEDGVGFFLGAEWAASLDPTEEEVEAAAQAMYEDDCAAEKWGGSTEDGSPRWTWETLPDGLKEVYLSLARAALLAAREVRRG